MPCPCQYLEMPITVFTSMNILKNRPHHLRVTPPPSLPRTAAISMSGDVERRLLLDELRREIMAAEAVESDLDLAYHLQLQEAMAASLASLPSSSATAAPVTAAAAEEDAIPSQTRLQAMELDLMDQEERDRALSEAEMRRVAVDLKRQVHDAAFAREILRIPDDEWADTGDWFERPIDAGASPPEHFKLYFKGVVAAEASLAAVAVAVCDPSGKPLLQIGRPVMSTDGGVELNRTAVELKALIEGLHALISLDIKRVDIIFDFKPLYNYVCEFFLPRLVKVSIFVTLILGLCLFVCRF